MRLREEEISPLYQRMFAQRHQHHWTVSTLQEALRQEWDLWYGKRHVKENTPPSLQDLLFAAEHPPVKVMKRRGLRP